MSRLIRVMRREERPGCTGSVEVKGGVTSLALLRKVALAMEGNSVASQRREHLHKKRTGQYGKEELQKHGEEVYDDEEENDRVAERKDPAVQGTWRQILHGRRGTC